MHRRRLFAALSLLPVLTLGCDALLGYNDLSPREPGNDAGASPTDATDATMSATGQQDAADASAPESGRDAGMDETGAGDAPSASAMSDGTTDAPSDSTSSTDAANDADANDLDASLDADANTCELPFGGDPCSTIAPFTGVQVIDGKDDDFCGVPAINYPFDSGLVVSGPVGPITLDGGTSDSAVIRVGWTTEALHVFVHVADSSWVPPPDGGCIGNCSSVEVYIAATNMLTGAYNAANDGGAIQILLSAPPTVAYAFYNSGDGRYHPVAVDPSSYTGVVTPDGYSIELEFQWPSLHPAPIAPGVGVGLDFAFDVEDSEDAGGRQWQAIFGYTPLPEDASVSPACGTDYPEPWCDDRTWCTPTLQ